MLVVPLSSQAPPEEDEERDRERNVQLPGLSDGAALQSLGGWPAARPPRSGPQPLQLQE